MESPYVVTPLLFAFVSAIGVGRTQDPVEHPSIVSSGVIHGPEGKPVVGAEIHAVSVVGPYLIRPENLHLLGKTAADGSFELTMESFEGLGPLQGISISAEGMASSWYKTYTGWHFPPIELPRGFTLSGRVRNREGGPVEGAIVVAKDMLHRWESPLDTMVFAPMYNIATSRTDEHGRFTVPGVLPHGLDLIVFHPEYMLQERFAVDVGDPLDFVLEPGGRVRGRVVDERGRPVEGTLVRIGYRTFRFRYRPYQPPVRTDAEGRFKFHRVESYDYIIHAGESDPPVGFFSETFRGDLDDAELVVPWTTRVADVPAPEQPKVEPAPRVFVKAKNADTGGQILEFVAAPLYEYRRDYDWATSIQWEDAFAQNAAKGEGGVARLRHSWLLEEDAVIAVRADGYATTVVDLKADRGRPIGAAAVSLHLDMQPEGRISGRVIDLEKGTPVAGANVVVTRDPGFVFDDWVADDFATRRDHLKCWPAFGTTTSDAAGRFSIGMLSEGRYQVFAQVAGSPLSATSFAEVDFGQHRENVEVRALGPTSLTVRLKGVEEFDPTWRLRAGRPFSRSGSIFDLDMTNIVPIEADGTAKLLGLGPGEHQMELLVPHPVRLGGFRKLDVRRFTVSRQETELEVDLSDVAPLALHGQVRIDGAPLPMHRLLVVAEPEDAIVTNPLPIMSLMGARAFVHNDGQFDLRSPPGKLRLLVVDAATGVVFSKSDPFLHGEKSREERFSLVAPIRRVRITLEPRDLPVRLDRLEIRLGRLWPGGLGRVARAPWDADTHVGHWLSENERVIDVYIPDTEVEFRVLGATKSADYTTLPPILARVSYTPRSVLDNNLTIEIAGRDR